MIAYRLTHESALRVQPNPLLTSGATGRWNSRGVDVTSLAEHPALAALEILKYVGQYGSARGYVLFRVDVPDPLIVDAPASIDPHDPAQTRPFGDHWAASVRSLALRVPSVAAPESVNVVLNQRHPALADLTVSPLGPFPFDDRVHSPVERSS